MARSGEVEIPAFGLDPEEFVGVEASIREERDSWSWFFTAYFTAIDGMIIRRPTGDVIDGGIAVTKQNAGDGRLYGVEGSLTWSPAPNLMWRTQFSAQRGDVDTFPTSEDVSVNEPISRLAPALMTSTVRWFPHGAPWHLEGRLRWSDLQDRLSSRVIPSGFLKAGRPVGRCWTWDGVSLLIMDLRSGVRMFLTPTIAATDQASMSQVEIWWCALNSRSDPASPLKKRAPIPLLSSPEFELV